MAGGDGLGRSVGYGSVGFAAEDGGAPEGFDGLEEGVAGLLPEDLAEKDAEGANVPPEGSDFEICGVGLEFGETIVPA